MWQWLWESVRRRIVDETFFFRFNNLFIMYFFLLGLWAAWLFTGSRNKQDFLIVLSGISCIISFFCLDFCLFLERERESRDKES